jgi:hypothetical protein
MGGEGAYGLRFTDNDSRLALMVGETPERGRRLPGFLGSRTDVSVWMRLVIESEIPFVWIIDKLVVVDICFPVGLVSRLKYVHHAN